MHRSNVAKTPYVFPKTISTSSQGNTIYSASPGALRTVTLVRSATGQGTSRTPASERTLAARPVKTVSMVGLLSLFHARLLLTNACSLPVYIPTSGGQSQARGDVGLHQRSSPHYTFLQSLRILQGMIYCELLAVDVLLIVIQSRLHLQKPSRVMLV